MQSLQTSSVEDLKRQSEQARADLTSTVRELRARFEQTTAEVQTLLSPSHVKDELKSYVRSTGEDFIERARSRARDNPLQAVAVAAALTYPALSIARRLPIPLALLGAGFWMAKHAKTDARQIESSGQQPAAPGAAMHVTDAPSIVSTIGNLEGRLEQTLTESRDRVSDMASKASERLSSATAAASQRLSSAKAAASEKLSAATAAASEKFSATAAAASETVSHHQSRARELASDARNRSSALMNDNPLLVAGLGLACGALLATLLPATRTEARVLGPASERLQDDAVSAARQRMNDLKDDLKSVAAAEGNDPRKPEPAYEGASGGQTQRDGSGEGQ